MNKCHLSTAVLLTILAAPCATAEEPQTSAPERNVVPAVPAHTSRLDSVHRMTGLFLRGAVDRVDSFFAGGVEADVIPSRPSRFLIGIDTVIEDDDDLQYNVDLELEADVHLPLTDRRLGLFLHSSLPDELPGEDPDDTEGALVAGLRRTLGLRRLPYLDFSAGLKVRTPPVGVLNIRTQREFTPGRWKIVPPWRGFWLSDDGFGELQSLRIDRWTKKNLLLRSNSAAKWTEESDGVEWEQSFLLALCRRGTFRNLDRGTGVRYQVFGHKSGSGVVDKHRVSLIYRRAVWRPWLYVRMGPEIAWENEDGWGSVPAFRIGVDALLWAQEDLQR